MFVKVVARATLLLQQALQELTSKQGVFVIPGMKEGPPKTLARHVNCVHSNTSRLRRGMRIVERVQTLSIRVMIG
jgi:hypothetical protein